MDFNNYYVAAQFFENGYIDIGSDSGTLLDASAEFSIASWICLNELKDGIDLLSCKDFFRFGIDNEKLSIQIEGLPSVSGSTSSNHIDLSHWHYVAVTYDLDYLRLYIDGVCVKTASIFGSCSGQPSVFCIGLNMEGKMRSLCIYNKGLSADEVNGSMFGSTGESFLVTNIDFTCNPPLDRKNPQRNIELNGNVRVVEIYPSLRLSENAFAMPSCKDGINPGGNNFDSYTIHALFRVSAVRGRQFIFSNSMPELDSGMALYLEYDIEEGKMRVVSLRGSAIEETSILISKSMIPINQWVSVATVYDSEKLSIYINGEKDVEAPFGPILVSSYQGSPIIGGRFLGGESSASDCLQGNISRLEVWDKALNAEEIRQYVYEMPEPDSNSLVCLYDFSVYHVKNEVDYAPLSMSNGAIISEYVVPAPENSKEYNVLKNKVGYDIDPILLQSFRSQAKFSQAEDIQSQFLEGQILQELALLLPECNAPEVEKQIKENLNSVLKHGIQPFTVTQHREGTEFFIVAHYPEYSYVAYRCRIDEIDECILYKIRLIFTIVAGIAGILLGVKPVLTSKATTFIQNNILILPQVVALLAAGTEITTVQLFGIGKILVSKGLLKELFKMILTLSFWSLVQMATRLILSFLGIGAAAMIASLSATVVTFIVIYADFVKHCLPFPLVTLYGIKFNHDLTQCNTSALNIRVNENKNVDIPEWKPDAVYPVAYAINQIITRVIICAKFTIGTILPRTVQIKAEATEHSVLGNVSPFECTFTFGSSNYVSIPVIFKGNAIGIKVAEWNWKYYDEQATEWKPMGISSNNVYLVQDVPNTPWSQVPDLTSLNLPSEQALKLACGWANGKNIISDIPIHIAKSLYYGGKFKYLGTLGYARRFGGVMSFDIHNFLRDYYSSDNVEVQCTDCATIVSVFSKLLGGTINCLSITGNSANLQTTFICAIGQNNWEKKNFAYHILNIFDNQFNKHAQIIDACIQVNGDQNPWPESMPTPDVSFVPGEVSHQMQYTTQETDDPIEGNYNDLNSYRERFFQNNRQKADTTNTIYDDFVFDLPRRNHNTTSSNISYQKYISDKWFASAKDTGSLKSVLPNFTLSIKRFSNFKRTERILIQAQEEGEQYIVCDRYETSKTNSVKTFIRVFTHMFCSVEAARNGFFYLLWGAELLKDRDEGIPAVGEISYGLDNYLCFIRNNVVIRISVDSVEPTDILESFAKQIDQQVCDNLV